MARRDEESEAGRVAMLLRQHRPLFALICEFNLFPNRYMHASWAEALFTPELWQRLCRSRRAEAALSRMVLRDLGLEDSFPATVFDRPAARLALLAPDALDRLALHLGIVVEGRVLRRVVDRESVARLRAALGAEAHVFAVQRAPLLAPAESPEAEEEAPATTDLAHLPERLRSRGMDILARAMAGLPVEVLKRFRLKLPRTAALDFTLSDGAAAAAALAARVLRETDPPWASLFAPTTA